jgi:hypothetical protein
MNARYQGSALGCANSSKPLDLSKSFQSYYVIIFIIEAFYVAFSDPGEEDGISLPTIAGGGIESLLKTGEKPQLVT